MSMKLKVDRLGKLRAQIADLVAEKERIENEIKTKWDEKVIEGNSYRMTLFLQHRRNTDWKLIAHKLNASAQMIRANTTVQDVQVIKVAARKVA